MCRDKETRGKILKTIGECLLSLLLLFAVSFLPTLHLYVNNADALSLGSLMGSVWIYTAIGTALFIILRCIFRKRAGFAGLAAGAALLFFINFAYCKKPFELFIKNYLTVNIVTLIAVAVVLVGLCFLLYKLCRDRRVAMGLLVILTAVFVGLLLVNCVTLLNNDKGTTTETPPATAITDEQAPQTTTPPPSEVTVEPTDSAVSVSEEPFEPGQPNVYLLLFDEFGSMGSMEKHYSYDASSFRQFLSSINMNWSEHSYSAYDETKYAMTDLITLSYESYKHKTTEFLSMRRKGALVQGLQDMGYATYQYSYTAHWFEGVTSLRNSSDYSAYKNTTKDGAESDKYVLSQSILGAFSDFFSAAAPTDPLNTESESLQKYGYYSTEEIESSDAYKKNEYREEASRILRILNFFEDPETYTAEGPYAIFSYIKCPHVPFMFDEYGNIRLYGQRMNWKDPQLYAGQYSFIMKHMATILSTILENDPHSIVIILSDHGIREHDQGFTTISSEDDRWCFNAVYFCGQELDIEGLSTVNTLRLVLSELGGDYPPLADYVSDKNSTNVND